VDGGLLLDDAACGCTQRGFMCRFTRFSRSMMTRFFSGMTRRILPVLPRSRPAMIMTVSSFRSR
jgi:hypothetical protein